MEGLSFKNQLEAPPPYGLLVRPRVPSDPLNPQLHNESSLHCMTWLLHGCAQHGSALNWRLSPIPESC